MRGAMPGLVAEATPTKALTTSAAIETDPCRIVVLAHLMTYLPMPRLLLAGSIFVICFVEMPPQLRPKNGSPRLEAVKRICC